MVLLKDLLLKDDHSYEFETLSSCNLPGACITCSEKAGLWISALSLLMAAEDFVSHGLSGHSTCKLCGET